MTTTTVIDKPQAANGELTRTITLEHLTAMPRFIWVAQEVAQHVFNSVSHDRLAALGVSEVGELLGGTEPMLKVVWSGQWHDGHRSSYRFLIAERYAEANLDKLRSSMEHRLIREVFREDSYLDL
jgi:hypothetical protein